MADQPSNGALDPFADLDFSFSEDDISELDISDEFLGTIVIDQWEKSQQDKIQWHLGVKPAHIVIKGDTGAFHTWCEATKTLNSKMGVVRTAFQKLLTAEEIAAFRLGRGQLLGQTYWFIRQDIKFGVNKAGQPMIAKQVLTPVRKATAEDIATIGTTPGQGAPTPNAPEWTPERVAQVLVVIDGKDASAGQLAAARNPDLPGDLKNAIMDGTALEYLLANGYVEIDGAGVVRTLAVQGAASAP